MLLAADVSKGGAICLPLPNPTFFGCLLDLLLERLTLLGVACFGGWLGLALMLVGALELRPFLAGVPVEAYISWCL